MLAPETTLQEENAILRTQVSVLIEQVASIPNLKEQIVFLKEQVEWFKRQLFGKKSERLIPQNPDQLWIPGLENMTGPTLEVPTEEIPAHKRKKRVANKNDAIELPKDIPVEKQVIDLPESEKKCPLTGAVLVKIGEEVTKKLAFRPGSYFVKEIVRIKYASLNKEDSSIVTPPLPESLLNRCFADESLLADILIKKYADHLPLYRQEEILARSNIHISRQTLCQWAARAQEALRPLYNALIQKVLESGNIFCDETPIDILAPGKGKTDVGYMWVIAGGQSSDPPYRAYFFKESRKHLHLTELIKDFNGVLHSDKYGAYANPAAKKQFVWAPCWAHIRRKFYEAEAGDPVFRKWVLEQIALLFQLEEEAWKMPPEERLRHRAEKTRGVIDHLSERIMEKFQNHKLLPKSKFREALVYFAGLKPYVKNFLDHPFARLDNNVAERAIKPLVIGRKNWLFFGSEAGGDGAAIAFSLIQSCRAVGINPFEYLQDVMKRIQSHSANRVHELLPLEWATAHGVKTR